VYLKIQSERLSASDRPPGRIQRQTQGKETIQPVRNYEIVFIVPSDVPDDGINGVVQSVQGWIEAGAGKVTEVNVWGRRQLQYPIRQSREGTYVLLKAELDTPALPEFERNMHLSPQILRHRVVRMEN